MKFPYALPALLCLSVAAVAPVAAQEDDLRNRVVIVENVRFDYAQVLHVEPVFQTLRATRTEQHCEPVSTRTLDPVQVKAERDKGRFGRFWESVRGLFREHPDSDGERTDAVNPHSAAQRPLLTEDCRLVEVGREFRRPIAYDVDYVYKGTKYRSRLPEDPGRRLKIRVSVTPQVAEEPAAETTP